MKRIILSAAIMGALLFTGCDKNEGTVPQPQPGFGAPTEVNIQLLSKDLTRALSGKEPGTNDENKVSWLEFYVFDQSGDTPDPEVGKTDDEVGNGYIRLDGGGLNRKIRVSAGTQKKMIVVANSNIGPLAEGYNTYETLKKKLSSAEFIANATALNHNSRTVPSNGFEMSGFTEATIAEGTDNNQVYVSISRMVSRINAPVLADDIPVELVQQEQIDAVWGEESGITPADEISFEFVGYAVINGRKKSTVSFVGNEAEIYTEPKTVAWNKWGDITGRDNLLSSFATTDGSYTNNYSGKDGASWFLDGKKTENTDRVYAYESKPTSVTVDGVPGYDPESVISYIIQGKLSTADGSNVQTRYWRVDIHKGDIYHLMRNCVYKVKINKITTPGHGTPEEAEKPGIIPNPDETIADFIISVDQWDINEYETEM